MGARKLLIVVLFVILLTSASFAFAETMIFTKEYTYQASEFDSKASSRTLALEQVKKLLLEELGTYLISETEVKNYQMTKDQITIFTAGIVKTEILGEKWDGTTYYLKAKIAADSDEVAKTVDTLRQDKQKSKELEDVKKRADDLEKEVGRLKQELTAKTDGGKIKQYNDMVNKLSATEWEQKGSALLGFGEKRGKNHEQNIEALKAFDKAIELNPENPDLYFDRAHLLYMYEDSKDYAHILADLDKAIALNPSANYHNMKAKIFRDKGEWLKVIQELEAAITLEPRYAIESYEVFSDKPKSDKDWSKKDFDIIITKFPKDYRSYILRGYFYKLNTFWRPWSKSSLKYYDLAITDYKKSIGLNSKVPVSYYLLGMTYADKASFCSSLSFDDFTRNDQMAIDSLSKAIKLNTSYLDAYRLRASINADLKEYKKVVSDYNKILEIDPESESTYYDRGRAFLELKQFEDAVRSFTSAMNAKKHDSLLLPYNNYEGRAKAYFINGKFEKALADYTKAIELREAAIIGAAYTSSDNDFITSELYGGRGKVYSWLGMLNSAAAYAKDENYSPKESPEYRNAISDFTQAVKLYSKSGAYEERADAYAAIQDYQHAFQDIDTSLRQYQEYKINPSQLYLRRANIYVDLGNLKQAINDFSQAIKFAEKDLEYLYYQRGSAYLNLDNNNAAIQDFSEAIKQSPKYTAAYVNRGVAYFNSGSYKIALSNFDKAVTLSPAEGIAYYNRGLARISLADQKRGIEDFKVAARLGYKEAQDKLKALNIEW